MIKLKKYKYYILMAVLCFLSFFIVFKLNHNETKKELKDLNYNSKAIKLIIENNLANYILNNNIYSETLEAALIKGYYNKKNLDLYVDLEYKDYDKYVYHLNELKKIGYKNDEINIIINHLNEEEIEIIINKQEKLNNLSYFIIDPYFNPDYLKRYYSYKNKYNNYEFGKIISHVNMNLDLNFYEVIDIIENPNDILVLVNKYNQLPNDYIPENLVNINIKCAINHHMFTIKEVKEAFEEMCMDLKSIGLNIKVLSAYRNYDSQMKLYTRYVERDGEEAANTYSAKPGHSEHQTGLALDVKNNTLSFTEFDKTLEYTWLKSNAHQYGFIIRYPKNKEHITGYKYEPWHLRYVGIETATEMLEQDLTFDEYYSKKKYRRN